VGLDVGIATKRIHYLRIGMSKEYEKLVTRRSSASCWVCSQLIYENCQIIGLNHNSLSNTPKIQSQISVETDFFTVLSLTMLIQTHNSSAVGTRFESRPGNGYPLWGLAWLSIFTMVTSFHILPVTHSLLHKLCSWKTTFIYLRN
jgi:hypothetical protein